jgi:hypothetical protein
MSLLMRMATAAFVLAVPVLAVCALAPAGSTPHIVAIAPGEDAVVTGLSNGKKPAKAPAKATKAGETSADVLTEEWVATGGGGSGGGSPKDKTK